MLKSEYKKYLWTFGSRIFVIGLTAGVGILSARLLGPTAKGTYTVVTLVPTVISTVAMLAGPQLVVMDSSRSGIVGPRAKALLRWSLAVAFVGAIFFSAFSIFPSVAAGLNLTTLLSAAIAFIGAALIVPEYLAAIIQARGKFFALAAIRVGQVLLPGVMMLAGVASAGLVGALSGFLVGSVLVGIFASLLWRKATLEKAEESAPTFSAAGHIPWAYVMVTNLSLVLLFLSYRVDVLVLNAVSSSVEVGIYAAAVAVAELVLVGSMSAAVVRAPVYARDRIRAIGFDSAVVLALSAVAGLMLAFIGPVIVPLLFGKEYGHAVAVMWALIPGIVLLALYRYLASADLVRGHMLGVLFSCLITLAVDVTLLYLLGPAWGAVGAGIAASASYAAGLAYLLIHRSIRDGTPQQRGNSAQRRTQFQPETINSTGALSLDPPVNLVEAGRQRPT